VPQTRPVLILEDSPAQGKIVTRLLEVRGCSVRLCASAADLEARATGMVAPECVFLDLNLGDARGVDLIPGLRQRWPRTAIVVMTADSRNDFESLGAAWSRGADLVLRKPFGDADVAEVLMDVDSMRRTGRRRHHVLIVDDSAVVCRALSCFLDPARFRVRATQDPKELMQRLNFDHVDVVLTDMVMPGMTGGQIIELVRSVWPSVPVIAMSGDASVLAHAAGAGGADACLKKPFAANELQAAVETAIASRSEAPCPADDFVLED
jgi:CheY-like chemotaxis protein